MMNKNIIAAILGVTAIFGTCVCANAATFTSEDQKFTLETPDDNWKEISDETSKMTLTNGRDYVTVRCYDKEAAINDITTLPAPTVSHDEFKEEVLTYYSTDKDVYVITGLSETKDNIKDVRFVVNSIQLADHNNEQKQELKKESQEKKEEPQQTTRTGVQQQIYYQNSNSTTVYEYTDGKWRDDEGVEYWRTTERQWANSEGSILYDYIPEVTTANKVGEFYIYWLTGNAVLVNSYDDGTYMDNDGVKYVCNGDGTWTSSLGDTLYDDDNALMHQNQGNDNQENNQENNEESDVVTENNDVTEEANE